MQFWLVKSEPFKYPWEQLEKDKKTIWDGVRNYAARNNLRTMKKGDPVLFYHSNEGKEIVGLAKVVKEHYQDPTTEDPAWSVVELAPVKRLKRPVTLEQIKSNPAFEKFNLLRLPRLSVVDVSEEDFLRIMELANTEWNPK